MEEGSGAGNKSSGSRSVVAADGDSGFEIIYIFYDGRKDPNEPDEYVEIKNTGPTASLQGYSLSDEAGKTFNFPSVSVGAGESIKIFTGCGSDTGNTLYWCYTESAVWNNSGDTATLKNSAGKVVDRYGY